MATSMKSVCQTAGDEHFFEESHGKCHEIIIDSFFDSKDALLEKKTSLGEKIASLLQIKKDRPSWDLVVTWHGLDAEMNVFEKKEVFKWQPPLASEDSWKNLELKIVAATVENGDDVRKALKKNALLPEAPYKWAREFFDSRIKDFEINLISRIEIIALKDCLSFVILDAHRYSSQNQCFWEMDGKPIQASQHSMLKTSKVDFSKFKEKNENSTFIKMRNLSLTANSRLMFSHYDDLLQAWKLEGPYSELFCAIEKAKTPLNKKKIAK